MLSLRLPWLITFRVGLDFPSRDDFLAVLAATRRNCGAPASMKSKMLSKCGFVVFPPSAICLCPLALPAIVRFSDDEPCDGDCTLLNQQNTQKNQNNRGVWSGTWRTP